MEVLFLVGISGSGKSTFAEQWLQENQNYLRINRDDLRKTLVKDLNGYYQRKDLAKLENVVNNLIDEIVHNAIDLNYNLIIDNTNLTQKYINELKSLIFTKQEQMFGSKAQDVKYSFKLFDCELNEAKSRIAYRDYGYNLHSKYFEKHLPNDFLANKTNYIEKQFAQYQQIKQYLLTNYKGNII
jgi:adenylate kinase family enzyme